MFGSFPSADARRFCPCPSARFAPYPVPTPATIDPNFPVPICFDQIDGDSAIGGGGRGAGPDGTGDDTPDGGVAARRASSSDSDGPPGCGGAMPRDCM